MATKPDFTKDELTIGDRYHYAMTLQTPQEAQEYLAELTTWLMRVSGRDEAESRRIELGNIGYFAGYYDEATRQRVYSLFNTVHPIFGGTTPTAQEALDAGKKLANAAR